MKRSALLEFALLGALGGLPAEAQQPGRTFRVGILTGYTLAYERPFLLIFRRTLSGLGYQEGKNLEILYQYANGDPKRLPDLAAGLVRQRPSVIVAATPPAIAAVKRATTSVPIVMTDDSDPVGARFVASLARPGGNITGIADMDLELNGKRLQLLKELVPRLQRVAVIRNPDNPANLAAWRLVESEAHKGGIEVFVVDVRSSEQINAAFTTIPHLRVGAVLLFSDPVLSSNLARIVRFVAAQRLPAVYGVGTFTTAGGLMTYGTSETANWSQAATYVDRILKGAKPADLPIERPTTFELDVNLKAARGIGITIPQSILLQANDVIR